MYMYKIYMWHVRDILRKHKRKISQFQNYI